MAGDFKAGIEQMTHGVNQPFNPGFRPVYLVRLAEQLLRAGRPEETEKMLVRALRETREHSNHFCEPDIIRLRGEVLLAQSRDHAAEAERIFREALALASAQSCRPLELRSALSLAQLMTGATRRAEARDLLEPIYATFSEGLERPELQAAKAMLAELA